jgi:hypothetical protein
MDNPSVVVNEVISSKHGSCRIGEMFHLSKHNYLKKFDTRLLESSKDHHLIKNA